MVDCTQSYINGQWVTPEGTEKKDIVNPATEKVIGSLQLVSKADLNWAVAAARQAFPSYSQTTVAERLAFLERMIAVYDKRSADLAQAITMEMGAPEWLAKQEQVPVGKHHLEVALAVLKNFKFAELHGTSLITKEPIGVCGLITPWNWPTHQTLCKIAPALAVGCTMIFKPAEAAPLSARILTEIIAEAGVPPGVFNMIYGKGSEMGPAMAEHRDIDMVSITSSARSGVSVAQHAAASIKRVHQELGGKGANIILDDADFPDAVAKGVHDIMNNSGQTCRALSRMLVPKQRLAEVLDLAEKATKAITVGAPDSGAFMGPIATERQWQKIQEMIKAGLAEGAKLLIGGPGKPEGLETGFYARPTIFFDVSNEMKIAQEEIFGPVLVIITYDTLDEAISLANGTPYGLGGAVCGKDPALLAKVARGLRAGQILVNYAKDDVAAPFGGYKTSGNGREWGEYGFDAYLEVKSILGVDADFAKG